MIGLLCLGLAVMMYKAGRVTSILLKDTGKRPELTLRKGQKFHLFNSHIWSTGQDATATIKRQLQRLLPDCRIFLDVDDLENIGQLEHYIDESAVILLFLS